VALRQLEGRARSGKIANIKTVLGAVGDPLFPTSGLDMVVVFDCLFEFSEPVTWMRNTKKYLKRDGVLVIVDPGPSRIGSAEHFLSRAQILAFAGKSGYVPASVDDSFLKSHMIVVLRPAPRP
jgi:hypothetical protein